MDRGDTIWINKKNKYGDRFKIEVYNDGSGASVVREFNYKPSLKYRLIDLLWVIF